MRDVGGMPEGFVGDRRAHNAALCNHLVEHERRRLEPLYVAEELGQLKSAEFADCVACAHALEAWAARERERLWRAIPDWFRLRR